MNKVQICFYDIEVTKNLFLCCVKIGVNGEMKTFEISERRNDFLAMVSFFLTPGYIFSGYNCMGYDTPMMNMLIDHMQDLVNEDYLIVTTKAYEMSAKIISGEHDSWSRYRFSDHFQQLDLMTLLASKALRVPLKALQVTMFYKNVKEMVVDWTKPTSLEDIDPMIFYCHNDVNSTAALGDLLKGQIEFRQQIARVTGLTGLTSKDPVGVGVSVFSQSIAKELKCTVKDLDNYRVVPTITNYSDLIQPCVKFTTPIMSEVLDWYKGSYVTSDDVVVTPSGKTRLGKEIVSKTITFNKLQHTFAQGGIHSVNKPAIYVAENGIRIIDIDAESLYPSLVALFGFGPEGFKEEFSETIKNKKAERVVAKKVGQNKDGKYTPLEVQDAIIVDKTNKLSLNAIIGHLRNKYGPYYAPQANAAICINGQLTIAMLIERMEGAGFECIMSNTDGITLLVQEERYEEFQGIYKQWESETGLIMEETEYEKMVITGVNAYISYKKGYSEVKDDLFWDKPSNVIEYNYGFIKSTPNNDKVSKYIKAKGSFGYYVALGKGLDSLIVAKALIDYFGKGIPVEYTIENGLDINDYLIFQKIGKQYDVVWNGQNIQHINRFYVSKYAPYLYKSKEKTVVDKKKGTSSTVKSMEGVVAGKGIQIFNEFIEKPIRDYKIDYSYYIIRARDIIRSLEPEQMTLF